VLQHPFPLSVEGLKGRREAVVATPIEVKAVNPGDFGAEGRVAGGGDAVKEPCAGGEIAEILLSDTTLDAEAGRGAEAEVI
jgi:hypothetical protein